MQVAVRCKQQINVLLSPGLPVGSCDTKLNILHAVSGAKQN